MSPVAAGREIGRIEATLAKAAVCWDPAARASQEADAGTRARNTHHGAGPRNGKPAIGELPMKDYIAERAKQGARWAR
jgi:hypothetical protein